MATRTTYLSIISLFLINHLKAQTGKGCFLKTCSQLGQVRVDAITNAANEFVGGCNCGCDPGLFDINSPLYCPEPKTIDFDPNTLLGDCSCKCPSTSPDPSSCIRPTTFNPEICDCGCSPSAPDPSSCAANHIFRHESCLCGCEQGDIGGPCIVGGAPVAYSTVTSDCMCDTSMVDCPGNQQANTATGVCECPERATNGAFFPTCTLPLLRDPITCDCVTTTTTIPPEGPIEVECAETGDCFCPFGTNGACTITCDGTTDACKDGHIQCNNDGYDCIVNCMSGSACAGSSIITGPVGASLTINCIGGQACEGSTIFNGQDGTDLTVVCEGSQSCKGNVEFNFGSGIGSVACNGAPDACQGATAFNLPINAETTTGVAFSCTGAFCPSAAPAPFSNVVAAPEPRSNAAPEPVAPAPGAGTPAAPAPGGGTPAAPAPGTVATAPGGGGATAPGAGGGGSNIVSNPIAIVQSAEIVICEGIGAECTCSGGGPCTIKCESIDACKESILGCPEGFDCTVICMDKTCLATTINSPIGHALTVEANGLSSVTDATINSIDASDVTFRCLGDDACKATALNCGTGACAVTCDGVASCDSSPINTNGATAFHCDGLWAPDCPPNYTPEPEILILPTPEPTAPIPPCSAVGACPCTHLQCFEERSPPSCGCECPHQILLAHFRGTVNLCGADSPGQVFIDSACGCDCPSGSEPNGGCPGTQNFNQNTCQCECPGRGPCAGHSILDADTCECKCPSSSPTATDCAALGKVLRDCGCECPIPCNGPNQIQSPDTCACGCPAGTPQARDCPSGVLDEYACECAAPAPSTFCCQTSEPGFKPWNGRCWHHQTEQQCNGEPNGRCAWDPANCHSNPPRNSYGNVCFKRDLHCGSGEQCCSEVCRIGGVCR